MDQAIVELAVEDIHQKLRTYIKTLKSYLSTCSGTCHDLPNFSRIHWCQASCDNFDERDNAHRGQSHACPRYGRQLQRQRYDYRSLKFGMAGQAKLLWTLVHCSMTLTRAYIIHAYCFVAPAIICTVYCLRSILKRTGSICTNDFIAIFNRVYNIYMYIFLYICMTLCIVIVVVPSNPPYTKHLYTAHNTSASTFSKKMFGHPWDRIIPAKTSLSLFSEFVRSKPETSTFI